MQMSEETKRGRPPLRAEGAKRAKFNTRLSANLREAIGAAAAQNQRSVSEEIETRLAASFRDCEVIKQWEGDQTKSVGGPRMRAAFYLMGELAEKYVREHGPDWAKDPIRAEAAMHIWRTILEHVLQKPEQFEKIWEAWEAMNFSPPKS